MEVKKINFFLYFNQRFKLKMGKIDKNNVKVLNKLVGGAFTMQ
jgi:hypothetical protein